jgi:hypothetical protein
MSLSITDEITSQASQHTIYSDMFLSSEIKGKVYNPGYYLSGNTDEIASHLDLVMLTNGWRRFNWEKIKAEIGPQNVYPIENGYMKLSGRVTGIKTDKDNLLNMIIVSKDSSRQFASVSLQKDGSFEHSVILFDTAKILYSINNDPSLTEKATLQIQNGLMPLSAKTISVFNEQDNTEINLAVKGKLDQLWMQQEALRKKMEETSKQRLLTNPKPLHRNPDIFTNQTLQNLKIEFYNNDFSKTFRLVLESINAAGKMTHIEKIIGANGIMN